MCKRRYNVFVTQVLLAIVSFLTAATAQSYEPILENFRLGPDDQLAIDRGGPVDLAGDVNGDNLDDILVGSGVGSVRVIFGPTRGNNGILNAQQLDGSSGFVIFNDAENDSVLAGIGDINGDGLNDIAVGSRTGTRIIFGSRNPFPRSLDVSTLDGSNGFVFNSAATDLKRAGDVNGDGLADFVVGNGNASPNGLTGAGVSYVIFGRRTGYPTTLSPSALDGETGFAIMGISAQDRSGLFVSAAGDFNNDSFDDILIGAPYQTTDGKAEAGAAYLLYGGSDFPAAVSLADLDGGNGLMFSGSDIQNVAGASVAGIGDLNHDGNDDIAIGAPGKGPFGVPSDFPGEVYVLFGGYFDGIQRVMEDDLNGVNGLVLSGIRGGVIPIEPDQPIWGDMAGADIDAAGDINGDGIDDILIGAPHTIITPQRKGVGQVYVVFGSQSAFSNRIRLSELDGSNGFRINGTGTVDYYAVSVARAGDFNADGRDDIMIGASGQGETYVFYGRNTNVVQVDIAASAPVGSLSTGFPAAALTLGADAVPLVFNERADPTGPAPLPPGTPTDPANPLTPGYTAPYSFNTAPVARPDDGATGGTAGGSTGDTDGGVAEPPGSPDGNAGAVVKTGGAAFYLPLLLGSMMWRRQFFLQRSHSL
jgi:hypothetical protein